MGFVVTVFIVVTQSGIQDERPPLMLQLHVGITAVLAALTSITKHGVFKESLLKVVTYLVADIVKLEMAVFSTKADVAFMTFTYGITVVTFQLCAIVLLLTIHIA